MSSRLVAIIFETSREIAEEADCRPDGPLCTVMKSFGPIKCIHMKSNQVILNVHLPCRLSKTHVTSDALRPPGDDTFVGGAHYKALS